MSDVQPGTRAHMQLACCILQGAHQMRIEHIQQILRCKTPNTTFSWPGIIKYYSHIGDSDGKRNYPASDDHTHLQSLYSSVKML